MRIGVLVPQAGIHPLFGENILAGLNLSLEQAGREFEVLPRIIEHGTDSAVDQARRLVLVEGVDLLVGLVGMPTARALYATYHDGQTPFIVCHPGAHVLSPEGKSPYFFRSSLNLWQAQWSMGEWAAQNLGKTAMLAVSFYEGGYHISGAFWQGFEAAGGKVVHLYITHVPPDKGDPAPLIAAVQEQQPDIFYACYSSLSAVALVRAFAASDLAGKIPLLGPGFLVEQDVLRRVGQGAEGVLSSLSWAAGLDTPENNAFKAAYQEKAGALSSTSADALAVLGYDTGRLIVEAANAAGPGASGEKLAAALEGVSFTGPRGATRMDAASHATVSPLYLRKVAQQDGSLTNVVLQDLSPVDEFDERTRAIWDSIQTGWVDAYLA